MKSLRRVLRSAPALLGLLILANAHSASAQQIPAGCNGSGISISIFAFFSDGVTPAVGIDALSCETLVFKAAIGYATLPPNNCAFQDGHLIIKTPDGIEHDVTPAGGIFVAGNPLSPATPGPINSLPVTYVVNPGDITGQCGGGTNNGTVCSTNAQCTGGGTCQNLQVVAMTSYNQSPNFTKGISFTGNPPSVGFNNGGSSIGVNITPCPTTFCAPAICDPNGTSPQRPGRKGLCVLGPPPVCPGDDCNAGACNPATQACVKTPLADSTVCDSDANGNPVVDPPGDCVHPGCEAGVCVPNHVPDPDSTVCSPDNNPADDMCPGCEAGVCVQDHISCKHCGNRGNIIMAHLKPGAKNRSVAGGGSPDVLKLSLRPLSTDPIDPSDKDVTVQMSTKDGVVFSTTVPAGSVKLKGRYYRYLNNAAKKTGGISRLTIWKKFGGRTQIYVDAYGDLGGAASQMDSAVIIGDIIYHHDGTWTKVPTGWKLPTSGGQ